MDSKLIEIFQKSLHLSDSYSEARCIARDNSEEGGRIWLIGGFVYRTLAGLISGDCRLGELNPCKDFDFILEDMTPRLAVPDTWGRSRNRFGNPKVIGKNRHGEAVRIDLVPLQAVYHIVARGQEARIENYLAGTPLNVQSIAYDIDDEVFLGEVGLQALEEKVVRVHDREMAEYCARLYHTTVNAMIRKKAAELGFRAEFPSI